MKRASGKAVAASRHGFVGAKKFLTVNECHLGERGMSINLRGCYLMPWGTESQGVCISYKRAEDSIVTEAIAWALREIRSHCISDSRIRFIVSGKRTTNKHDQCLLIRIFSTMEVPWIWLTVSLARWMRMGLTVNMGCVTKFVLVRTRKVLSRYPDLPQRHYYSTTS